MLLGIEGKAGHGKDTVADMLIALFQKRWLDVLPHLRKQTPVMKYSLASPIKEIARFVFDMTDEEANTLAGKQGLSRHGYGKTNRELLQLIGTESFRDIFHEDIWLDVADRKIESTANHGLVIIPDIRFENEAQWLKSKGKLIQVVRSGVENIAESTHASEQGFSTPADYVITNDGTLEELRAKVEELFEKLIP